ncbi:oxidoreductase [Klebsiella variicola]|nr:oxidoreductase [Klebsiella variicola]
MEKVSQHSDLVFDAVGGELANTLLSVLPASSLLISYGLLSGQPLTQTRGSATVRKFHLREALPTLSVAAWRAAFDEIWLRLPTTTQPPAQRIALNDWREAIAAADQPEEAVKSCSISPRAKITFSSRQGLGFRQRSSTASAGRAPTRSA